MLLSGCSTKQVREDAQSEVKPAMSEKAQASGGILQIGRKQYSQEKLKEETEAPIRVNIKFNNGKADINPTEDKLKKVNLGTLFQIAGSCVDKNKTDINTGEVLLGFSRNYQGRASKLVFVKGNPDNQNLINCFKTSIESQIHY